MNKFTLTVGDIPVVIETDATYIIINGDKIEISPVANDMVRVRIYPSEGQYQHKINFIKAMRTATGCGLKEGKDISEAGHPHVFSCSRQIANNFLREMKNLNVSAEIVTE